VDFSGNPKLSAPSAALSGKLNPAVNLVDTLNAGQFTVFAPVDNAFSRLPPEAPPRCNRRRTADLPRDTGAV
jgi:uncharacterized surface protein with fasciclin (FAS1) repeats